MRSGGKLYPLSALTTGDQWSSLYHQEGQHIYAEAFVVVSYVVSTFGQDRVLEILKQVRAGESASYAVKDTLGKNETEILDAVKKAPQSVIFEVTTTTTSLVTTTARVESSTMTSTVSVTTTQQALTTAALESVTTQKSLVTAPSAEQGTSTQFPTELILAGAVIVVMVAVSVIVIRSRKKRSPLQLEETIRSMLLAEVQTSQMKP
jgi:transglutaminase/protease-like cytokinesis protein 3